MILPGGPDAREVRGQSGRVMEAIRLFIQISVHREDFRQLLGKAQIAGLEVALDLAFQCSPDHPYVTQHPEWFTSTGRDHTICGKSAEEISGHLSVEF